MTLPPLDILLGLFVLLQALDFYTTHTALELGAVEANPVVRWLIDKFDTFGLLAAKVLGVGAGLFLHYANQPEILVMLCIVYAYVVWGNFRVIRNTSR